MPAPFIEHQSFLSKKCIVQVFLIYILLYTVFYSFIFFYLQSIDALRFFDKRNKNINPEIGKEIKTN